MHAHLVNDLFVETEGDVRLKGDGHSLEERAKAHPLVPLPNVLVVAAPQRKRLGLIVSTFINMCMLPFCH